MSVFWRGLNAQELQSPTVHAIGDVVEMGLIDGLAREDRTYVFRFHLRPTGAHSVDVAEPASRRCPLNRVLARHLLTVPLFFSVSERSAQRDGPSSPTGPFPLGDLPAYGGTSRLSLAAANVHVPRCSRGLRRP